MALSDLTSPTAIRLAIRECDRIGRDEFLQRFGFGHATEYVLSYEGKEYDSKAIAGVAHDIQNPELPRLTADRFSGGTSGAARRVFELGFDVVGMHRRDIDWTLQQCEITADAYFACLKKKLRHEHYNRAAICREVSEKIGRTSGAVDYKFQNIDAVLLNHGLPRMMDGVAPNVQRLLEYVVLDPLAERTAIFDTASDEIPPILSDQSPFVDVPVIIIEPETGDAEAPARPPTKIDFAERDARNRKLGRSGESWVVELEKRTLINAARKDLAERVDWVSDRLGDGLGYDIVSFDELGADKFIEVKTTNASAVTPFYISPRELAVADHKGASYRLYRVFDFGGDPRVFVLNAPLIQNLHLVPRVWSAVPKPTTNQEQVAPIGYEAPDSLGIEPPIPTESDPSKS